MHSWSSEHFSRMQGPLAEERKHVRKGFAGLEGNFGFYSAYDGMVRWESSEQGGDVIWHRFVRDPWLWSLWG